MIAAGAGGRCGTSPTRCFVVAFFAASRTSILLGFFFLLFPIFRLSLTLAPVVDGYSHALSADVNTVNHRVEPISKAGVVEEETVVALQSIHQVERLRSGDKVDELLL